jgi:hypothetical protein
MDFFRRVMLVVCAAVVFAAPLTAAFAAQPCAAVAAEDSPCDCEDSTASSCALSCGTTAFSFAVPDAPVSPIQASADRVVGRPATAFISSVGPPGLQPPR